ncbi:hypothetical protein V8E36_005672 [Tilletia maclaganii]
MAALFLLFVPLRVLSPVITLAYPLYESYKCITLSPSALRQASSFSDSNHNQGDASGAVPAPSWTSRLSAYGYGLAAGGAPAAEVNGRNQSGDPARTRAGRGSNAALDAAAAVPPTAGEVAELESWLMYWSILAIIHLVESTVEWIWNWIPLYAHLKILFEFWLVLPQTRGATFLYITYVEPFLDTHENDIDDLVAEGKRRARAAGVAWLSRLWAAVRDMVVPSIATAEAAPANGGYRARAAQGRAAPGRDVDEDRDDDEDDDEAQAATGPTYRPYWPGLRGVNPNTLFEAAMSALNTREGHPGRPADGDER